MGWQDQGRQEHGWFGHGTSGNEPDPAARALAVEVAYGALGHLPAQRRGSAESWLQGGGLDQVAAVLPAWRDGSGLGAERFRILFFGEQGSTMVAGRAQAVGEALAQQDRRAAGAAFARMVDPLSAWTLARVMAAAVGAAQAAPRTAPATAPHPAAPRPATPPVSPEEAKRQAAALRARNIDNMARVIFTEARGNGRDAMTAVGHTIHNRMIRNEVSEVDKVWGGYRHGAKISDDPARWEEARRIAAGILDGVIADTTGGATHDYSPNSRTTAPLPAPGQPNAPGHETVPGVIGKDKRPAQNTFPDWSRSSEFQRRLMPGIPEKEFKFYRQTKEGHVR